MHSNPGEWLSVPLGRDRRYCHSIYLWWHCKVLPFDLATLWLIEFWIWKLAQRGKISWARDHDDILLGKCPQPLAPLFLPSSYGDCKQHSQWLPFLVVIGGLNEWSVPHNIIFQWVWWPHVIYLLWDAHFPQPFCFLSKLPQQLQHFGFIPCGLLLSPGFSQPSQQFNCPIPWGPCQGVKLHVQESSPKPLSSHFCCLTFQPLDQVP